MTNPSEKPCSIGEEIVGRLKRFVEDPETGLMAGETDHECVIIKPQRMSINVRSDQGE